VRPVLFAALWLFLGQQPSQPIFKSGINLVEVDVVVTDAKGRPVRGLGQHDFEVLEDGKPVSIVTFAAVDVPQAPADSTIPPADRSGTSVAGNDQPQDGRVMLIVLDDHHVRFDAGFLVRSKAIARRLVERLGPSDQAAVIATSGRSTNAAEFTTDKARLAQAIDKFFPQADPISSAASAQRSMARAGGPPHGGSFGFEQEIKARWAMEALSNAASALAQIPHRRKAILLVSEGLPVSVEQIVSNPNASGAWDAMRDFLLTAQRFNVAVYTVDPCGLSLECSTAAQDNLRVLAEHTGGFAVVNTNAPEESVERIVAENGTYYLLGYSSPAAPNDGRRHRITVRIRERGLDIRAREGYVSPRRPFKTAAGSDLDRLVAGPIQTRGLTMRAVAVPAPLATSPGSTIVVALELAAKDAAEAGQVDFAVLAIDADGKVRARQLFTNSFEMPAGRLATGWARVRTHLAVPSGRYQIRVAGIGSNRTQGSVFTEIEVPKFDDKLAVGGLSLVSTTPGVAANPKHMADVVPLSPLADREVPAGRTIAEVPIRVGSRASGPLSVTTTLVRPDGGSAVLGKPPPVATEFTKPSGHVYRIELPSDLAPGTHRLVVDAAAGGSRVTRELVFRVAAR
jgi:VWFA-related protein